MTTVVPFQPTPFAPVSFMVTLDGQQYTVTVTWNLFGQRWYFNVSDLSGDVVLSEGLVGSPSPVQIASLAWANGLVTATTVTPHGFLDRSTTDLTVAGCAPSAYSGAVQAYIQDKKKIFWPVAENPGPATQLGTVSFDIDLVEQYFQISTVVFRESTQQFEISP